MLLELSLTTTGLLLLACHVIVVALLVQDGAKKTDFHVYRFYSPQGWFALFYALFFLMPAFVALLPGHHVIGFEAEGNAFRLQSAIWGLFYLLTFLLAVLGGSRLTSQMLPSCIGERPLKFRRMVFKGSDQLLLLGFFVCGLLATLYLASKNIDSEQMRSALVKTTSGKVVTAVSFFGNFAFAVLLARSFVTGRLVVALAVVLLFVPAVFLTGSRGRFLWPCVLSLVYLFSYRNAFDYKKVAMAALLGFSVLVFSDAFLLVFKNDRELNLSGFQNLFTKRNFDGFANFTLISTYDQIPRKPMVALTGARHEFMYHYFPKAYQNGVGCGSTWPGMSWIAGGWAGVIIGGVAYGYLLGGINVLFRKIRDERLFWAYLFAMTWIAAVGGNFQESVDKMAVAATPGIVWFFFNRRVGRKDKVEKKPQLRKPVKRKRVRTRKAILSGVRD